MADRFRIPSPDEQVAYGTIVSTAFATQDGLSWIRSLGIENNRVLVDHGEVSGGLVRYDAGQWFGGERLSMAGIAGVAVEPHRRGLGAATRLMREAVFAFAEEGYDLAALYSGFLSAEDLALRGLAEGSPRELARATSVFSSSPPAMRDFF